MNQIILVLLFPIYVLSQSTTTSSSTTTTLIECAENQIFIPAEGKCINECPDGQHYDTATKECKTTVYYQGELSQLTSSTFHMAQSCQEKRQSNKNSYYTLNQHITNIKAFELVFKDIISEDKLNLQTRLAETATKYIKKRTDIFKRYNENINQFSKDFKTLFNAKDNSDKEVQFLGKQYKESDLAKEEIMQTYELQKNLLLHKKNFNNELSGFYKKYYDQFANIEKRILLGMNTQKRHLITLGKTEAKDKHKMCWMLWPAKSYRCWAYKTEFKNAFTLNPLKNHYYNDSDPSNKNDKSTWEQIASMYPSLQQNKFNLIDYPVKKNFLPGLSSLSWWHPESSLAKHARSRYERIFQDHAAAVNPFASAFKQTIFHDRFVFAFRRKKTKMHSENFFKQLISSYEKGFKENLSIFKSNDDEYIDPELSIKKKCLKSQDNKECENFNSTKKHVVSKALQLFFLYSNHNDKNLKVDATPDTNSLAQDWKIYKSAHDSKRVAFFKKISEALYQSYDTFKLLGSEEWYQDSIKCINGVQEDLATIQDSPYQGGGFYSGTGSKFNTNLISSSNFDFSSSDDFSSFSDKKFRRSPRSSKKRNASSNSIVKKSNSSSGSFSRNIKAIYGKKLSNKTHQSHTSSEKSHSTNKDTSQALNTSNKQNRTTRSGRSHSSSGSSYGSKSRNSSWLDDLESKSRQRNKGGVALAKNASKRTPSSLRSKGIKSRSSSLFKKITDTYVESAYPTLFAE